MRYLTAAGLIVVIYDLIESFPDELELVWKGRVGIERTLYLVHRHVIVAGLICAAQMTSGFVDMSDLVCHGLFGVIAVFMMIGICCADAMASMEVWMYWDLSAGFMKWISVPFILQCAATVGFSCWTLRTSIRGALAYDPQSATCAFVTAPRSIIGCWAAGLIFEVILLASAVYNILDKPRPFHLSITHLVCRDACYLFVVLGLRAVNLVLSATREQDTFFIPAFCTWALVSVIVNRFILDQARGRRCHWSKTVHLVPIMPPGVRFIGAVSMSPTAHEFDHKISIEVCRDIEEL